jgi:hypothetical protein
MMRMIRTVLLLHRWAVEKPCFGSTVRYRALVCTSLSIQFFEDRLVV